MKYILVFSVAFLICSCATSLENLQRATANEVGNTLTKEVKIFNVKRGVTSVSWQAKTPTGCYECDADDMVRRVHCVKIDCATIDTTKQE
jgi:hypothetical protein